MVLLMRHCVLMQSDLTKRDEERLGRWQNVTEAPSRSKQLRGPSAVWAVAFRAVDSLSLLLLDSDSCRVTHASDRRM